MIDGSERETRSVEYLGNDLEVAEAPGKYRYYTIHKRLGHVIKIEHYYGKGTREVIDGFEDLIGEPLGADLFYNTQGTGYQLAFALSLSSHPVMREVMESNSKLSQIEAVRLLRERQVLSGFKIMDLGCGLPTFGLVARSLGAEVYTADVQDLSPEHKALLNGHMVLDLNEKGAAKKLQRETGGKFDLITENIIGGAPGTSTQPAEVERETIEHIATAL